MSLRNNKEYIQCYSKHQIKSKITVLSTNLILKRSDALSFKCISSNNLVVVVVLEVQLHMADKRATVDKQATVAVVCGVEAEVAA